LELSTELMRTNTYLSACFASFFCLAFGCFPSEVFAAETNDKDHQVSKASPNFILIVIDDLGYGDIGIYGNKNHLTPNIDKLAKEGLLLTDFHSNGSVCSPTRAALMTGQYQQRAGVEHAIGFNQEEGMPLEKITIAEMLRNKGYKSGVFGKWHLGHVNRFGPNDQGFDQSVVSNNTPDYHTHISREGEYDWYFNHEIAKEEGYLTDLVTKHSVRFIRENRDHPFFLFVSHPAVHFPFQGPDDPPHRTEGKTWHDSKYGPLPESQYRRAYRDMLEAVDLSVGKVVEALNETDQRGNTLIFITSDNGAYSWVGSNFPYRGQKGDLFEGGHRVPAIANWPGHIAAGSISDATTMTMDIAPTLLSLAGMPNPENVIFDGVDMSPVFLGNGDIPQRLLFWRFNNPYDETKSFAVRHSGWKYVETEDQKYLFYLNGDPTESNNIIDFYQNKASRLHAAYQKWIKNLEN
jgi:arylsulfatase A